MADNSREFQISVDQVRAIVPRMTDYFGVWAIQPEALLSRLDVVGQIDLLAHVKAAGPTGYSGNRNGFQVSNGVAVIDVSGSLMKFNSSLADGTSTVEIRQQIRAAVADDSVTGILLLIDSPGGTVSGTKDLADDVTAANEQKPVVAYIEDLCASAAYWVASQASKVYSNATAIVGSIGTFMVMQDTSAASEKKGIKVHVVRAGDHKGAGTPGTEITDEHLAEWQATVDQLNDHFVAGVAAGRQMSVKSVQQLADGRVHVGEAAQKVGLIDGVQSFDETLSQLQSQGAKKMAADKDNNTPSQAAPVVPAPATLNELQDACPDADAAFYVAQLKAGATVAQAQKAWGVALAKQLKEANDAKAKAEQDLKVANARRPGARVVGKGKKMEDDEDEDMRGKNKKERKDENGDDIDDEEDEEEESSGCTPDQRFSQLVREQMKLSGCSRQSAVKVVGRTHPRLHKAALVATNPRKVRHIIDERFDSE